MNDQLRVWMTKLNGRINIGTEVGQPGAEGVRAGHLDAELIHIVTTATGAVDFAVPHTLNRVPVGVIPLVSENQSILYRDASTPPHTANVLWFRSAAPTGTKCTVLVF